MSNTGFIQYHMRTVVQAAPGAIIRLPSLFEGLGAKRVLLLSDNGLKNSGIVDQLISVFNTNAGGDGPALVGIYTDIATNSTCESVNNAVSYMREIGADAILAVGGGSVLDAAKGVKYAMHHKLSDLREALQGGIKLETWPNARPIAIPHIAVPTTAGTGAEVSAAAVFYNEDLGIRCNLVAPFIDADFAVLDANLTLGLPKHLTASTGMDALTHAIEALASPAANDFTDAHAIATIRLIEKNLPIVTDNGRNVQARHEMLQASTMAINAFGNCLNAIPVHNCAHAFGALFHIPHGVANCVLLPIVLETLAEFYLPNAERLASALQLENRGKSNQQLLEEVIARIRLLQEQIGGDCDFSRYSISSIDIERIVVAIATDPAGVFYPIPPQKIAEIVVKTL
ncbi:MAG: alcohol dehydrogenase class IV [Cognaticolwellia sp.]|jgi:alcohol dehydrogenase class IV